MLFLAHATTVSMLLLLVCGEMRRGQLTIGDAFELPANTQVLLETLVPR